MIKSTLILMFTLASGVSAMASYPPVESDNPAVKEYRDNPDRLDELIECLLKKAPCKGLDAKVQTGAVLMTACGSCADDKKDFLNYVFSLIEQKDPESYNEIMDLYYPKK